MLNFMTYRAVVANCLFILACLPGCVAFSDSSAMRIEVEVYKGPLSLEPEIQIGELFGYLREAYNGLQKTQDIIQAVGKAEGLYASCSSENQSAGETQPACKAGTTDIPARSPWCADNSPPYRTFIGRLDYADCSLLKMLSEDVSKLQRSLLRPICVFTKAISGDRCDIGKDSLDSNTLKMLNDSLREIEISSITLQVSSKTLALSIQGSSLRDALIEANRAAAIMQASAFRYATAATGGRSTKFSVRKAQTHFIVATSEYANQIQARTDALLKQLGDAGHDRRELPLSTHLREAEPTDFVHLYSWMSGHTPSLFPLLVFSPLQMSVTERIKVVDRLYANHFWSKINTVYASGRGKTQMAFIKDETGNWNLKSFDNDPTELLDAYTEVTKTALKKAAEAAAAASTGGLSDGLPAAQKLFAFAVQTELKPNHSTQQTVPAGTLSLGHLRTRLMDKLDPVAFKADFEKETELLKTVQSKEAEAKQARAGSDNSLKQTTEQALVTAQTNLSQHRQQVAARLEAIINDHSNLVDILSSTAKNK